MTHAAASQPIAPAGRDRRSIAWFLTVALVTLAADLVTKSLAFEHVAREPVTITEQVAQTGTGLPAHEGIALIPGVIRLHLTVNRGAVFGLGQGQRWLFILATIVAVTVIGAIFWHSDRRDRAVHLALGLILAGAIGNLYDRLRYGVVRDLIWLFPEVKLPFGWTWPGGADEVYPWIFNLADVALVVGVGLIFLSLLRRPRPERAAASEQPEAADSRPS